MLFYDNDAVVIGHNQKVVEVYNTMYHAVHNNHWLNLTLNDITKYVLFTYCLSAVCCANYMFLPIGETFLMISGLVPIISISSSSTGDFCYAE